MDALLTVYGNKYSDDCHFLAIQFTKPPVVYHALRQLPVQFPADRVIVFRGGVVPVVANLQNNCLIYLADAAMPRTCDMLLHLLLPSVVTYYYYYEDPTLYAVTRRNPYEHFTIKCRKDKAFRAICDIYESGEMTVSHLASFRHFKQFSTDPKAFGGWFNFTKALCRARCVATWGESPSVQLGRRVWEILGRSSVSRRRPSPFEAHECEILLTKRVPLGILCLIDGTEVLYVSPMVVSRPPRAIMDVNRVTCNCWMPLYRNYAAWQSSGLKFYVENLTLKTKVLKNVMSWLLVQTVEKYESIHEDMMLVSEIILGDESKWFERK